MFNLPEDKGLNLFAFMHTNIYHINSLLAEVCEIKSGANLLYHVNLSVVNGTVWN